MVLSLRSLYAVNSSKACSSVSTGISLNGRADNKVVVTSSVVQHALQYLKFLGAPFYLPVSMR